eukprot:1532453-Pyramimonas_sp.AAC.1
MGDRKAAKQTLFVGTARAGGSDNTDGGRYLNAISTDRLDRTAAREGVPRKNAKSLIGFELIS